MLRLKATHIIKGWKFHDLSLHKSFFSQEPSRILYFFIIFKILSFRGGPLVISANGQVSKGELSIDVRAQLHCHLNEICRHHGSSLGETVRVFPERLD